MTAKATATALDVDVQGQAGALAIDVAFRAADVPLLIVGPNGSGKTSVLMMILGALAPRRGRVALDGTPLFDGARGVDVPVERRRIGFVPQRYALFPHLDVLGNVAYGLSGVPRAERDRIARDVLAQLDAGALAGRRATELSGGEMQRVALARALAVTPHALLMDEPLAALDISIRRDVRRFLAERVRLLRMPTVIVTHDLADAEALDGQIVVIEGGRVAQTGRLAELAAGPQTEFVRQFVAGRAP
jgi:molybdate transport system ATP-binding protein